MNPKETFDYKAIMKELLYYKHLDQEMVLSLSQVLYDYALQKNDEYCKAYALLYFSCGYLGIYKLAPCLEYGQQAYQLQKKNHYIDLLQLQANILGNAFMYKNDFQSAMKYFTEALQYAKEGNDNHLLSAIYNNMADLYRSVSSYDRALEYYKLSYETLENLSDNPLNISIRDSDYYLVLSKINVCLKDYQKANFYLEKCRMLSTSDEVPHDLDFDIQILEAKMLQANDFDSQTVIDKVLSTFELLDVTSSKEYIDIFNAYYDGISLLFQCGAFSLCENYGGKLRHLAEYLDLPFFWLRYYDLAIQILEALLDCSASDHIDCEAMQQRLFNSYQQFCHYSKLRDKDINREQLLRLKDLVALHEAEQQNSAYRHNISSLKLKAEQDELSGCANRHGLMTFLNTYFDYMTEAALRFSCILIDIDYFKQYNDNYGHLAGDECIRKVSLILKESAQEDSFLARYGGDEFILIFINKTDEELLAIASTIKANLAALHIPHAFSPAADHVTLTQGLVNRIPRKTDKPEDLLQLADQALYIVKQNSRNDFLLNTD